jgi:hypothetical protein
MQKGAIRFARIGTDVYTATFETEDGPPLGPRTRTFPSLADLEIFLHLVQLPVERVVAALRAATDGRQTMTLSGVVLCDHELLDFSPIQPAPSARRGERGPRRREPAPDHAA